jgi:hypothetical protein
MGGGEKIKFNVLGEGGGGGRGISLPWFAPDLPQIQKYWQY